MSFAFLPPLLPSSICIVPCAAVLQLQSLCGVEHVPTGRYLAQAEISALLKDVCSASKVQGMLKRDGTSTRAQKTRQMGLVAEG